MSTRSSVDATISKSPDLPARPTIAFNSSSGSSRVRSRGARYDEQPAAIERRAAPEIDAVDGVLVVADEDERRPPHTLAPVRRRS